MGLVFPTSSKRFIAETTEMLTRLFRFDNSLGLVRIVDSLPQLLDQSMKDQLQ